MINISLYVCDQCNSVDLTQKMTVSVNKMICVECVTGKPKGLEKYDPEKHKLTNRSKVGFG